MAASPQIAFSVETKHPWFAVTVRTCKEQVAVQALRGKNYECLLPTYPERRHYSDRNVLVQRALFPGYIFCRFDPWRRLPVLTTPAVQSIVSFNKTPHPVNESEIAALQRIVDSGVLAAPWPYLRIGKRVRIEEGPLNGVEGLLCSEKGKNRLVVSVDLLQRSVCVEIDRYSVRPI